MCGRIRGGKPVAGVVVGAHLDLGFSGHGHGTGSASVWGSRKAIVRSGMRPRRTSARMFTGEEEGLDGSLPT